MEAESVVVHADPPAWLDEPSPTDGGTDDGAVAESGATEVVEPEPVRRHQTTTDATSMPEGGDGEAVDALAGWDLAPHPSDAGRSVSDGLVAIVAVAAGVVVGAASTPSSRARGAVVGALAGAGAAVAARRMWRVEGPDDAWATNLGRGVGGRTPA